MDNNDIDKPDNTEPKEVNNETQDAFMARGCNDLPGQSNRLDGIYKSGCCKYDVHDWLQNIQPPENKNIFDCVEVRFKNSRKEFFRYTPDYELLVGDIVAVESSPGHDIGIVSLTGEAVRLQMSRKNVRNNPDALKKIYRKARVNDIEKWVSAVGKEEDTKIRTRKITRDLNLEMKINDVEFQGDITKAIFYYTADERVDFRELIKVLAEQFKIRIEMKQIGARQEASRVGGIGSCGRELCCSTWMCNFSSVTTNAARTQQLSLNPQKLAGQCGKLKCCLNYEYDTYLDTLKKFPDQNVVLQTKKGNGIFHKADVFKELLWYSYEEEGDFEMMAIPLDKVKIIISMNQNKKKPEKLEDFAFKKEQNVNFENAVDQGDLKRFDKLQ
jgi:cell fate regulator YaaT (PSP1 superfamily)